MDPRTQAPSRELAPGASDRTSEDVAVPTPPCVDAMLRARARGSGDRWRACVNRPLAPSSSQIDPLGHTNGWSTATRRRPAGSHLLDHLAVGTHHRVLQPKLFEQGQDPSEVARARGCTVWWQQRAGLVRMRQMGSPRSGPPARRFRPRSLQGSSHQDDVAVGLRGSHDTRDDSRSSRTACGGSHDRRVFPGWQGGEVCLSRLQEAALGRPVG